MTTETITIRPVRGSDLHHTYPGQLKPQPVYVYLDCQTRTLSAAYDSEIGNGVPAAQYAGLVQAWEIPALRADAANTLLDEIAPLAERVCGGFVAEYDQNGNLVAEFDEDAEQAREEIEKLCDQSGVDDMLNVWDAADWLGSIGSLARQAESCGITHRTTEEELDTIQERLQAEARAEGVDELDGLRKHLRRMREATCGCQCGRFVGTECDADLRECGSVTLEVMPRDMRASHEASGNAGSWPHNGALRLTVTPGHAQDVIEEENGWARVVDP